MVDRLEQAKARHATACMAHFRAMAALESSRMSERGHPTERQRKAFEAAKQARADAEADLAAIMEMNNAEG